MDFLSEITGVTVSYNTKDLLIRSIESIRKVHPSLKIIIVDGSDNGNPCEEYIRNIIDPLTTVLSVGYNIGHGRGMCIGLYYVETKYALIFDTDIVMLKSPLEEMVTMMEDDTFGVGYIEMTGRDGFEYGLKSIHHAGPPIRYLHPYFQLINKENYRKFHPYIHHGAPCIKTMTDIHDQGLSEKIIKEFPNLGHSGGKGYTWEGSPKEYILHDTAGTRRMRKQNGLKEIEPGWEESK